MMDLSPNARAVIGGNNPPSPFEDIAQEIADLYDEARNWCDGDPITNEDQHDAVSALYNALHFAGKQAEEMRVAEVKPLDDAKKAIQDKYNPLIGNTKAVKGKVVLGKDALGKMLSDWRARIEAAKRAEAERLAKEAAEEKARAIEAIRASSGNLEAREDAEAMLKEAEAVEKQAKRADRDANTGNRLRTVKRPELTDLREAIAFYWKTHRADFEALVQTLAERDVRAGKTAIPGFEIITERKAI